MSNSNKNKYRKYNKRKKPMSKTVRCDSCSHCVYIGEGGYMCDMTNDIVIEDWIPTEDYYNCEGVNYNESK